MKRDKKRTKSLLSKLLEIKRPSIWNEQDPICLSYWSASVTLFRLSLSLVPRAAFHINFPRFLPIPFDTFFDPCHRIQPFTSWWNLLPAYLDVIFFGSKILQSSREYVSFLSEFHPSEFPSLSEFPLGYSLYSLF